ncbi:MalY/PatB family protein [Marinomonas sp.]
MTAESIFDQEIDRTQMDSDKWSKYPPEILPMWVADMDFDAPEVVKKALAQRVNDGVFGYTHAPKQLTKSIISHLQTRYQWSISAAHILHLPGLVCALHLSVRAYTQKGEGIIVPGPVYYHLTKAPELADRDLTRIDMHLENDRWVIDMQQFEQACLQSHNKMILLCNPHNPGGTVYTREELAKIHTLAEKYDLLVVSDEIHCDLILDQVTHVPFASLNEDAANRCITLMAPSKTFNLAGLGYAFAVIANSQLRTVFNQAKAGVVPSPNMLGFTAAATAYAEGQSWHEELLAYLRNNSLYLQQALEGTPLRLNATQATYLAWIDASKLKLESPYEFFLKAGVGVSDGKDFGNSQFVRLNFGCPISRLEEAVKRIKQALKEAGFS